MRKPHRQWLAMYLSALVLTWTTIAFGQGTDRNIQVTLADSTEINIEVIAASGSLLVVWFVDYDEESPEFESMIKAINASGIEVWLVDLLADYFLPRSSEQTRTLSGAGVAAVIDAAHENSDKTIVLAAYDRMPLPLLRGVRTWSARFQGESRLAGSILYHPNLFGPAPIAGEAPELDPVVAASNYPVVIVQPEKGSQRWRLNDMMQAFWSAGAPAYVALLDKVKDWFFIDPPIVNSHETRAREAIPQEIVKFASLMQSAPKPKSVIVVKDRTADQSGIQGLIPFAGGTAAPPLNLLELDAGFVFSGYRGRISLINFWATWCPPCVEELPSLNRLKRRFAGRPFNLLSVDFRETDAELRQFTRKVPVEFPILLDLDGKSSLEWRVFSFPSSFLVDHNGTIRYSINRAIDWDTAEVHAIIETLLAEVEAK